MKDLTDKQKLRQYLEIKGISYNEFYRKNGFAEGFLNGSRSFSVEKLKSIIRNYPDLNVNYLLFGEGDPINELETKILLDPEVAYEEKAKEGFAPYYELPVSAGNDQPIFAEDQKADYYIQIPGVKAKAYFPIHGASMEPLIRSGDFIGVDEMESWDHLDPEKIYLIITKNDRMIKHLQAHESDDDLLMCLSPNYKPFTLRKENIIAIYKVVFYGRVA